MHNLITTSLAVLTALCTKHVLAQRNEYGPPYWCEGFNQTGNYTRAYEDEYSWQISDAVICNSTNVITSGGDKNGTCAIQAGGFFRAAWHTNVSDYNFQWTGPSGSGNYTYGANNAVAYTITNVTGAEEYSYGYIGGVKEVLYNIEEGTNAYIAFAPLFRCLSGWLSECPIELKLNDTYVELCSPILADDEIDTYLGGISVYEGNSYIKIVNETFAANMTRNPNERPPRGLSTSGAGMVRVESLAGFASGIAMLFALV